MEYTYSCMPRIHGLLFLPPAKAHDTFPIIRCVYYPQTTNNDRDQKKNKREVKCLPSIRSALSVQTFFLIPAHLHAVI